MGMLLEEGNKVLTFKMWRGIIKTAKIAIFKRG